MLAAEEPADQHQIGKSEQREQLRVVLCRATIAHLTMLGQALYDMKAVLDFCPYAGLVLLHAKNVAQSPCATRS